MARVKRRLWAKERKTNDHRPCPFSHHSVEKEHLRPILPWEVKKQTARERRNRISKFNDNSTRLLKTRWPASITVLRRDSLFR